LDYFGDLRLREFSIVNDQYELERDADVERGAALDYGCGLFWFARNAG
jgi:hypothetical protein